MCAKFFRFSFFPKVEEIAITSHPQALANCRAKWLNPPTPIMPIWSVGETLCSRKGEKTIAPSHKRGAGSNEERVSGIGKANLAID